MQQITAMIVTSVVFTAFVVVAAQDAATEAPAKGKAKAKAAAKDEPGPAKADAPKRVKTDNALLGKWLEGVADAVQGQPGRWVFKVGDRTLMVMTDENADRMRIMADVGSAKDLSKEDLLKMMHANFDRALDARYAVFQGRIWSVYIHPLGDLTKAGFESGVRQVIGCVENYGKSYSSGELQFGGQQEDAEPNKDDVF